MGWSYWWQGKGLGVGHACPHPGCHPEWGSEETSPVVLGEGPASSLITEELRGGRAPKARIFRCLYKGLSFHYIN